MKLLLAAGADPNRRSLRGYTYFERAAGLTRIVQALEKAAGLRGDTLSMGDFLRLQVDRAGHTIAYGRFRSQTRRTPLLEELERRGSTATDELVSIVLTHSDNDMRSAAAEALALLGATSHLRDALQRVSDPNATTAQLTRRWIAHALADLGPKAREARPDLEALIARGLDTKVLSQLLAQIPA